MTEEPAARISIIWAEEARSDLRAIDRQKALEILHCLDRYISTRNGDIKKLKPPLIGYRLRCGNYRLFFDFRNEAVIEISGVRNRREAYR